MEKSFFFKNADNCRLFGHLFRPDDTPGTTGIIVCQPIAEERCRARRMFVNMARWLSNHGYPVLFFDYYGEGESEGDFEESDVDTRVSDVLYALKVLRENVPVQKIGLIGLRLGALFAELAALQEKNIDFNILINPVVNGHAYLQEWLRFNLASQFVAYGRILRNRENLVQGLMNGEQIETEGFILSREFYQQLAATDLIADSGINTPVSLVELKDDINKQDRDIMVFASSCRSKSRLIDHSVLRKTFDWKTWKYTNPPQNLFELVTDLVMKVNKQNGDCCRI